MGVFDNTSVPSDKTYTWQQENLTPPTGQLPSENLQDTYGMVGETLLSLVGSGKSSEIYDEEGNVIAHGGYAFDAAFTPFLSKQTAAKYGRSLKELLWKTLQSREAGILETAGNLANRLAAFTIPRLSSSKLRQLHRNLNRKMDIYEGNLLRVPKKGGQIATTVRSMQDEVARELGSKKGFKRYLNTVFEPGEQIKYNMKTGQKIDQVAESKTLINDLYKDKNLYQAYKDALISNINQFQYKMAIPSPANVRRREWQGVATAPWNREGYRTSAVLEQPFAAWLTESTKIHEYTHAGQLGKKLTGLATKDQALKAPTLTEVLFKPIVREVTKSGQRTPRASKVGSALADKFDQGAWSDLRAGAWPRYQEHMMSNFQDLLDKNMKTGAVNRLKDEAIQHGLNPEGRRGWITYMRDWWEVTARINEIRYAEKLGKNYKDIKAYKHLNELYDDKFITTLKNKYWAIAPLVGLDAIQENVELNKESR